MKKITGILMLLMVLSFFTGCVKNEQSDEKFRIVGVVLLDAMQMPDGRIDALLRPTFEYSNSLQETVVIEESWKINNESMPINDYETLIPTAGAVVTKEAIYAIRCVFPKGTTEVVLSGEFIATYRFGNIVSQLQEKILPVVL